jgi:hypothetical protein
LHGVVKKKPGYCTRPEATGWLAKTTCETVAGLGSSHDETGYLLGQDEFSQAGGLQPVGRAVVHDIDRLLAAQEFVAVNSTARIAAAGRSR